MLKRSEVLKANQFRIVLNWVLHYHWENKEISTSIKNTIEHYREGVYGGIEIDITLNEVKNRLKKLVEQYVNDDKMLKRDIDKERKTYVVPSAKNVAEFFKVNELPFRTVTEYQNFLRNYVVGEF